MVEFICLCLSPFDTVSQELQCIIFFLAPMVLLRVYYKLLFRCSNKIDSLNHLVNLQVYMQSLTKIPIMSINEHAAINTKHHDNFSEEELNDQMSTKNDVAKPKKGIFGEIGDRKLETKIEKLEQDLAQLKKEYLGLSTALSNGKERPINCSDGSLDKILQQEYDKEMKRHIRQLKKYNELKDLAMGIIQLIADQKQSTLRSVMNEMGVEPDDK